MLIAIEFLALLPILFFAFPGLVGLITPESSPIPRRIALPAGLASLTAVVAIAATLGLSPQEAETRGASPFLFRLDAVDSTLLVLISFLGPVILGYSRTYLQGEPGQNRFMGLIGFTLASVCLVVVSGHLVTLALGWIGTGVFMHRLLLFYATRPGARRAARKKFFVARSGDVCLIAALGLLAIGYGTGDIGAIVASARDGAIPVAAQLAAWCLALAALLKSAQFPTHSWLTEVMEAPTPVSALLHAGVINAGGYLLIRFSDILLASPGVLPLLALIGGFTALYAGMVMLTQPAVKTSLAWSTVAQMGFMIFQCGLGLFGLALLHIIAHSLYKAHAFLSAGSAVGAVMSTLRPGPVAVPGRMAITAAFATALMVYAMVGALFDFEEKAPQAVVLGGILVLGLAYLLAQGFAGHAPRRLTVLTTMMSAAAATAYFLLQEGIGALLGAAVPPPPQATGLEWAIMIMAVASFGLVALAQSTFPLWAHHPAATGLRVHLSNGLYVTALTDRFMRAWRPSA